MIDTPAHSAETRVLYNGSCPVCRAEIAHYAAYARDRALPLTFEDLGDTDLARWGIDADAAARRLHVETADGLILSGMPAFRVLWREMPRYSWLARLTGAPVIRPLATAAYDHVAAPLLYRWHRKRTARAENAGKTGPAR